MMFAATLYSVLAVRVYDAFRPMKKQKNQKAVVNTESLGANIIVSREFVVKISYNYENYYNDSRVWKNLIPRQVC